MRHKIEALFTLNPPRFVLVDCAPPYLRDLRTSVCKLATKHTACSKTFLYVCFESLRRELESFEKSIPIPVHTLHATGEWDAELKRLLSRHDSSTFLPMCFDCINLLCETATVADVASLFEAIDACFPPLGTIILAADCSVLSAKFVQFLHRRVSLVVQGRPGEGQSTLRCSFSRQTGFRPPTELLASFSKGKFVAVAERLEPIEAPVAVDPKPSKQPEFDPKLTSLQRASRDAALPFLRAQKKAPLASVSEVFEEEAGAVQIHAPTPPVATFVCLPPDDDAIGGGGSSEESGEEEW